MEYTLYIGTYTQRLPYVDGKGEGIYSLQLDAHTGALSGLRLAASAANPSFLALDAPRRRLFAVNELEHWHGRPGGAVSAYQILPGGGLQRTSQRLSGGAAPCYLSVTADGGAVLAANYATGTVARLGVTPEGGLRSPHPVYGHAGTGPRADRQEAPHAHAIAPDPSGRWALAADLGADKLYLYQLTVNNLLPYGAFGLHPGSGPRHFAFSADGRRLYLANELDSTVSFFTFDPEGPHLAHVQTVPALPASAAHSENTLAHLALHPSGRWLYASNRGHDSLAVFSVDPASGALAPAGQVPAGGRVPRHFALTPEGSWLVFANQNSDSLALFALDGATGMPVDTGARVEVPTPVCVVGG
jgi:6-phosphogluconolactonase